MITKRRHGQEKKESYHNWHLTCCDNVTHNEVL